MTNPHNFHQVGKPCKAKKKKVNEVMQSKTKNANATLLVPKISQPTILGSCY